MTDAEILQDLKDQLGVATAITSNDNFFNRIIAQSKDQLEKMGIFLQPGRDDSHARLVADYSKYLYLAKTEGAKMPSHVLAEINNVLFAQKSRC